MNKGSCLKCLDGKVIINELDGLIYVHGSTSIHTFKLKTLELVDKYVYLNFKLNYKMF